MWKGDGSEKDDGFVTRPILSCLHTDKERINQFYERLNSDASFVVETMLERYSAAVVPTPRIDDIVIITDISDMICRFMNEGGPDSVNDYLTHSPDVIPLLLKGIRTVLQDTQHTAEHNYAVYCSFTFVASLAPFSESTMRSALVSGILNVSLEIASNPKLLKCGNRAESLINKLQSCLIFRPVTTAAVASINNLVTRRDFNLPQMLRSTNTLFRKEWTRFETLLLEQAVILSLFDNGFAVERGSCASCKTIASRKDFFKCSGCDILLYCSTKCQESDWGRHRVDCKIVNEYLGKHLSANISRAWRRQGILQANRYWSSIIVLAQKKEIPLLDLGVQITYNSIPFKLDVFDCRKVDPSSVESILSKEVLRASSESLPCFMLKTILPRTVDIFMVYLNDARDARGDGEACRTQGAIFVDEDNNRLYPTARDVVSDIISQSHALSKSDWRKLWGSKPFEILAKKAMEDGVVF
ncbi:hypothetical protein SCHPADRAFT_936441 [Schizopora paradoxa]|uniref:MYND-type domain-containing protein n=1 Tax=Schizopora paradoxa TaxID=27342 RepID=A0A0H2S2B5_9AGAM|nr:hypothetical protein SCHPADRAFT_936441 [Schizopora paradoxa]